MKCNQQALFRYTWAGQDESFCCLEHAQQLQGVAQAMGYYVQLIPLSGDEQMKASCSQEVRANNRLLTDLEDQLGLIVDPPLAVEARMGIISEEITRITSSGQTPQAGVIEAFIAKNGTVDEWAGDKLEWRTACGFFIEGWLANSEAVEQLRARDEAMEASIKRLVEAELKLEPWRTANPPKE